MRLLSYAVDGEDRLGIEIDGQVRSLAGHREAFPDVASLADVRNLAKLRGLAPTLPLETGAIVHRPPIGPDAKIFCIGINYLKKHPIAGEVIQRPAQPTIFVKTFASIVGHGELLEYPAGLSEQLDYECELTAVIGKPAFRIGVDEVYDHISGYTVLNDGSVRDWQKISLFSGKNFFHASSCGPSIVTADAISDPMNLSLATRLNGEEVQSTTTAMMLFNIREIISHISKFTPLAVGDLVATGSPGGSGGSRDPQRFLRPGDRLDFEIGEVGTLSNTVR